MHRRLLPRELWGWWTLDTTLPLAVTLGIVLISTAITRAASVSGPWVEIAAGALTSGLIASTLCLILPHARQEQRALRARLNNWLKRQRQRSE